MLQTMATVFRVLSGAVTAEQIQDIRCRCHLEREPFSQLPAQEWLAADPPALPDRPGHAGRAAPGRR